MSTIYGIRNRATGRIYIGQTNCTDIRWRSHKNKLRRGAHSNSALQWDWVFYGEETFDFVVLEDYHRIRQFDLERREYANIQEFKRLASGVYNLEPNFWRK